MKMRGSPGQRRKGCDRGFPVKVMGRGRGCPATEAEMTYKEEVATSPADLGLGQTCHSRSPHAVSATSSHASLFQPKFSSLSLAWMPLV